MDRRRVEDSKAGTNTREIASIGIYVSGVPFVTFLAQKGKIFVSRFSDPPTKPDIDYSDLVAHGSEDSVNKEIISMSIYQ